MLQPPPQRDEDEQHRRRVEERHRAGVLLHGHGRHHDAHGVQVGDGGGQDDEDVHVGAAVLDRLVRVGIEVAAADELGEREKSESRGKKSKTIYLIEFGAF